MHPRLDPRLRRVLADDGWQGLTAPQEAALDPLLDGAHALVVAPTGHGKTEAAILPVLSRLLAERDRLAGLGRPWPSGFKLLYVTPLRALNRDLLGRLTAWCSALGVTVGVRHGDTKAHERAKQSRDPPDILITTPETVQLLLFGDTLRSHLHTVRFVVLDEVHEMARSERGAQLMVALERIEEAIAQPAALRAKKASERPCPAKPSAPSGGSFQRIGLSATVADPTAVARWMGGQGREVTVIAVDVEKRMHLHVERPEPTAGDVQAAGALSLPPETMAEVRAVRDAAETHARVLVFANTRDAAEVLVSRSGVLDQEAGQEPRLALHHGSLSAEHRQDVETRFKSGDVQALVATSSLELGIDVGAIDHVVQLHSPRSVARLVQRMGRAGHRVGATSDGTLLASGPEDAMECIVVAEMALRGELEPLQMRPSPLVVLANQLVALTTEYTGLEKGWCWEVVQRAGPFAELDEDLFEAVWQALLDTATLKSEDRQGRRIARSGRARRHFLSHVSLIPDERTFSIVDEVTRRRIGTVDESFVLAGLSPGALFVMAGRSWRVVEVDAETTRIRVAPSREIGPVPQWGGSQLPVSYEVAQGVARLRQRLLDGEEPPVAGREALAAARGPVLAHAEGGRRVPTDRTVTIEVGRGAVTVNVALGTRGNEALGRITQALLHQRIGHAVAMESDAYRIHLRVPGPFEAGMVADTWRGLDPDTVDVLLSVLLQESPVLRHHLVHVAKHFGALPKEADPTRTTRARIDALLQHAALQEEATDRLLAERMDLPAVARFLRALPNLEVVVQGVGPLSTLGAEDMRRLVAPVRSDTTLLEAVRRRIMESDVMLTCCNCGHHWDLRVHLVPRQVHCRRCGSNQVACLRPWHEELAAILRRKVSSLNAAERRERQGAERNAALVASFGPTACMALVGRGIGPTTAARILQKVPDPEEPAFWREILHAELEFARTNAYWRG